MQALARNFLIFLGIVLMLSACKTQHGEMNPAGFSDSSGLESPARNSGNGIPIEGADGAEQTDGGSDVGGFGGKPEDEDCPQFSNEEACLDQFALEAIKSIEYGHIKAEDVQTLKAGVDDLFANVEEADFERQSEEGIEKLNEYLEKKYYSEDDPTEVEAYPEFEAYCESNEITYAKAVMIREEFRSLEEDAAKLQTDWGLMLSSKFEDTAAQFGVITYRVKIINKICSNENPDAIEEKEQIERLIKRAEELDVYRSKQIYYINSFNGLRYLLERVVDSI